MAALEVSLRTVLVVVFGTAFFAKVRSRAAFTAFAEALGDLSWLRGWRRLAVAAAIPLAEAATLVLLVLPPTVLWGFACAATLLAVFAAVTGREVASGHQVRCRCFGASSGHIGRAQVVRNLVLLGLSIAGLGIAPLSHGGVAGSGLALAVGLALVAGVALVRWDDIAYLVRVP
jgi:Methylamine utilisation protein MauE